MWDGRREGQVTCQMIDLSGDNIICKGNLVRAIFFVFFYRSSLFSLLSAVADLEGGVEVPLPSLLGPKLTFCNVKLVI